MSTTTSTKSLTFLCPSWDQPSQGLRHLQVSFLHMSLQTLLLRHLLLLHLHLRHPHHGSDPQGRHWNTRSWTNYPVFPPQCRFLIFFVFLVYKSFINHCIFPPHCLLPGYIDLHGCCAYPLDHGHFRPLEAFQCSPVSCRKAKGMAHTYQI